MRGDNERAVYLLNVALAKVMDDSGQPMGFDAYITLLKADVIDELL